MYICIRNTCVVQWKSNTVDGKKYIREGAFIDVNESAF